MRATVTRCDRCGGEENARKIHRVSLDRKGMDLCDNCLGPLKSWLSRDNTTSPGDNNRPRGVRGPGWREVCPHYVPCAGPCPSASYERVL